MAATRIIEEERGTYVGFIVHAHNSYYAGDFSRRDGRSATAPIVHLVAPRLRRRPSTASPGGDPPSGRDAQGKPSSISARTPPPRGAIVMTHTTSHANRTRPPPRR